MRRKHSARTVSRQHAELAWAAPQVIFLRTARMLATAAAPQARDHAEFLRMFTEKSSAFSQAWVAGWMACCWAPCQVAMALLAAPARRGERGGLPFGQLWRAWQREGMHIAGAGLAPVHRVAVANARRLARR